MTVLAINAHVPYRECRVIIIEIFRGKKVFEKMCILFSTLIAFNKFDFITTHMQQTSIKKYTLSVECFTSLKIDIFELTRNVHNELILNT